MKTKKLYLSVLCIFFSCMAFARFPNNNITGYYSKMQNMDTLGTYERLLGELRQKSSIKRSYNIQLKKPGTLLSVISLYELYFTDSLTISGFIYDTDLKVLNECQHLRYLDIRKAYPMNSPETQNEIAAQKKWLGALGQLIGAKADTKYVKGKMGTSDYVITKGFAALMADESKIKKSEKSCVIPNNMLKGCESLETLLLPYRCSEIRV